MRISIPSDVPSLAQYIPRFVALAGEEAWQKRWKQLDIEIRRSPALWKIAADCHWLELLLHDQVAAIAKHGKLEPPLIIEDFAVLHFAALLVEIHAGLSPHGQNVLEGRVRSALNTDVGFAPLYLEMDVARRLFDTGNDVSFPDLEGTGQFDIEFEGHGVSGEVECKSQSADAGRKIHRKDFYRFIDKVEELLGRRAEGGAREILLVTLKDRLPADTPGQAQLVEAVSQMLANPALPEIHGEYFKLTRDAVSRSIESARNKGERAFYDACNRQYGDRLHIAGPITDAGICIVVMRSVLEDDTSKPWLEAMEKAATQFSRQKAGFIAVQFNDLAADELLTPSLRRRALILCGAVFRKPSAAHVAGTLITPYRGLVESPSGIGAPAFGLFNPKSTYAHQPSQFPAFYDPMSDRDFARLIGAQKYRSHTAIRLGIMRSVFMARLRRFFRRVWRLAATRRSK